MSDRIEQIKKRLDKIMYTEPESVRDELRYLLAEIEKRDRALVKAVEALKGIESGSCIADPNVGWHEITKELLQEARKTLKEIGEV